MIGAYGSFRNPWKHIERDRRFSYIEIRSVGPSHDEEAKCGVRRLWSRIT